MWKPRFWTSSLVIAKPRHFCGCTTTWCTYVILLSLSMSVFILSGARSSFFLLFFSVTGLSCCHIGSFYLFLFSFILFEWPATPLKISWLHYPLTITITQSAARCRYCCSAEWHYSLAPFLGSLYGLGAAIDWENLFTMKCNKNPCVENLPLSDSEEWPQNKF